MRAGIGQRGLPFKAVTAAIAAACEGFPGDLELVLRIENHDGDFTVSSFGPTATQLVRRYQRKQEGPFTLEEAKEIYMLSKELWDSRTFDERKALSLVEGTLRSFKEGYEGQQQDK